jgi:hypothetical protein
MAHPVGPPDRRHTIDALEEPDEALQRVGLVDRGG